MLTCLVPLAYLFVTVYTAGWWMVSNVYLNSASKGFNVFNGTITIIEMVLGVLVLLSALKRWYELLTSAGHATPAAA